jgi:probable rRNA maturation factor
MKTNILNQQKTHPLQEHHLQRLTDWISIRLEAATAPEPWNEVSIVLVDNEGIIPANREYFGKNRPTDVISFRYDPVPGEPEGWCGDLIINVDRAVQEGIARGKVDYELALYIAHGFNHLSGAEDNTDQKRKKMRSTETAWLREAEEEGLLDRLFESPPNLPEEPA